MKIVAYLPARHRSYCATIDPTPSACDCGAEPTPLVALKDAEEAVRQAASRAARAPQKAPEDVRNQALTEPQKNTIRFAADALEGLDYEDTAGDLRDILRTSTDTPASKPNDEQKGSDQ